MSAPPPPRSSGTMIPRSPSSPIRLTVPWGKRASRSHSAAMGLTSCSANSRARPWTICCSSVSSNLMVTSGSGRLPFVHRARPATKRQEARTCPLLLQLAEFLREEWDDLEQIADEPEVGDLEDRRVRVLVHGADDLGGAHAGQMLDRPRDPTPDVELGGDGPASLSDLEAVRPPPRVDGGARGAHRSADHSRELLEQDEVLGALEPPPARHDDLGLGQLGQARLGFLPPLDEASGRRGGDAPPLNRRLAPGLGRGGLEDVR